MNGSNQQSNRSKSEQGKSLTDTAKSRDALVSSQQILAPKRSKPNVMQSSSWMSITGK